MPFRGAVLKQWSILSEFFPRAQAKQPNSQDRVLLRANVHDCHVVFLIYGLIVRMPGIRNQLPFQRNARLLSCRRLQADGSHHKDAPGT